MFCHDVYPEDNYGVSGAQMCVFVDKYKALLLVRLYIHHISFSMQVTKLDLFVSNDTILNCACIAVQISQEKQHSKEKQN